MGIEDKLHCGTDMTAEISVNDHGGIYLSKCTIKLAWDVTAGKKDKKDGEEKKKYKDE